MNTKEKLASLEATRKEIWVETLSLLRKEYPVGSHLKVILPCNKKSGKMTLVEVVGHTGSGFVDVKCLRTDAPTHGVNFMDVFHPAEVEETYTP